MSLSDDYKKEIKRLQAISNAVRKYNEELKEELKAIDRETEFFNNVKLVRKAEKIANGGDRGHS